MRSTLNIHYRRTDAEAEAPIFWPSDGNRWLIGKVPDVGENWEQKEERASEDEMAWWHHWCHECELVQTLGDGEGQRDLVCYRPRCCKESDMTERLNNNNNDSMMMHDTNVLSLILIAFFPSFYPSFIQLKLTNSTYKVLKMKLWYIMKWSPWYG